MPYAPLAVASFALLLFWTMPSGAQRAPEPAPAPAPAVIDMHLHALGAADQGPPPLPICAPFTVWPTRDARWSPGEYFADVFGRPQCEAPLWSPESDEDLRTRSLALMSRLNVIGVASGSQLDAWRAAAPERVLPARAPATLEEGRALKAQGELAAIAEVTLQYTGHGGGSPKTEALIAMAEALDVPIGIHVGPGPPGAPYLARQMSAFRMTLADPLLLEDALVKHPGARVWVMHAGWPMTERMIALLYAHPQVYVDVGVIVFAMPRAEFYRHLRGLIEAGFERRVMFGSDQMVWPEALERAIASIEAAPFLSATQKRAILHDNAARFLRLGVSARPRDR